MMEREKRILLRVGFFVSLGLVLLVAFVFLLGGDRGLFSKQSRYTASFHSIDGLKAGAPVRLAGVQVGQVVRISFFEDLSDARVRVEMSVMARYADRIRTDTTATIAAQGVLGDKVVDLSLGSPDRPQIPLGGEIPSSTGSDYTAIIQKGAEVIDNTLAITADLRQLIASYNTPELRDGVSGSVESLRDILDAIRTKDGALHALIYDPQTGRRTREILASASALAARVDASFSKVDGILAKVQRGEGLVGSLFTDKEGERVVQDLGKAARELSSLAEAIRTEEDGLLHGLIYGGGDGAVLSKEITAMARDMRAIVGRINDGDGSLGAIINDPTIYEDLKTILGNVKRNRILRSLVRYSISNRDEIESYGKAE